MQLTHGFVAVVDAADYALVTQYDWWVFRPTASLCYAQTHFNKPDGTQGTWLMHRLITGDPPSQVDHKDGDGLNNRRSNLRLATPSQNMGNAGPWRGRKYRGAFQEAGRWRSRIQVDGKRVSLGSFTTEEEAARAWDAAAIEAWGDYARLNFPLP